jgi:hypothetical protein
MPVTAVMGAASAMGAATTAVRAASASVRTSLSICMIGYSTCQEQYQDYKDETNYLFHFHLHLHGLVYIYFTPSSEVNPPLPFCSINQATYTRGWNPWFYRESDSNLLYSLTFF